MSLSFILLQQMERAYPSVCAAYREAVEEDARAKTELKEQAKALAKRHREGQKGMCCVCTVCVCNIDLYE